MKAGDYGVIIAVGMVLGLSSLVTGWLPLGIW